MATTEQNCVEPVDGPMSKVKSKKKQSLLSSLSKRIAQALGGSSKQPGVESTPTSKTPKKYFGSLGKFSGSKLNRNADFLIEQQRLEQLKKQHQQQLQQTKAQQQQRQTLRQTTSVSNCRSNFMDTIPEKPTVFEPFSPESHILPQSPYHKEPNQVSRSFFKSKSTAAFRDLNNPSLVPDRQDALTQLLKTNEANSPSQQGMIMRDWGSCAMAAEAAAKRRPTVSSHSSINSLLRAYSVPSAVVNRLAQFNITSVEQLAQMALRQPNETKRIMKKVSINLNEHQRLSYLIYDLVNMTGANEATKQTRTNSQQGNVTNSSTDSGVYGSDGDVPSNGSETDGANENSIRDYLSRAQIDLANIPYSDKFGFGQIQVDWAIALADLLRFDPQATAHVLDKLRIEALRNSGRIGVCLITFFLFSK